MQKSKIATLGSILIIILYGIFMYSGWTVEHNFIYLYVINPVFWLGMATFLRFGIGKTYETKKNRKEIIEHCLVGVLAYIIIYMVSRTVYNIWKEPIFNNNKRFYNKCMDSGSFNNC